MNPTFTTLFFPAFTIPFWPGLAAVSPYALSSGRLLAVTAALLGLAGIAISIAAFRRQKSGAGTGRRGALVAFIAALIAILLGTYVVVTSPGGIGTGNGRGGAYVAVVLGSLGLILNGIALARSRRAG